MRITPGTERLGKRYRTWKLPILEVSKHETENKCPDEEDRFRKWAMTKETLCCFPRSKYLSRPSLDFRFRRCKCDRVSSGRQHELQFKQELVDWEMYFTFLKMAPSPLRTHHHDDLSEARTFKHLSILRLVHHWEERLNLIHGLIPTNHTWRSGKALGLVHGSDSATINLGKA